MARPTKLTKEMAAKAVKYLDIECKMGGLYFGDLPQVAGLAIYLDVARATLYEWAGLDTPLGKQFSDIMERVSAEQEYKLVGKGLKGEYNSTITKLMLTKHGYVDRAEVDQTLKGAVEFINDVPRPKRGDASS